MLTRLIRCEPDGALYPFLGLVSALTKTEVLGVFQNILSEKGYSVNSIGFDQGITTEYHYNDDYKVAYCNGLKLDVEKQVKEYRR